MSILERVVPLITEAVVEATVGGGGERRGFLVLEPISAFFRGTFLYLSSLVRTWQCLSWSGWYPLITEAVVEAGGIERWRLPARVLVSAFAQQSHLS